MTYRRIEVNAYRRRMTIVSGEWPSGTFQAQPATTDDEVSRNHSDSCAPIKPDSPEGQLLLVEAVRSLEHRLSPETRAAMCDATTFPHYSDRKWLYLRLQSLYQLICSMLRALLEKEK
jgi:hypothetical protein